MLNPVIRRRVIESRLAECEQAAMMAGMYLETLEPGAPGWNEAWDAKEAAVESERKARRALIELAARRFNAAMAMA